jgi:hypothetical protein
MRKWLSPNFGYVCLLEMVDLILTTSMTWAKQWLLSIDTRIDNCAKCFAFDMMSSYAYMHIINIYIHIYYRRRQRQTQRERERERETHTFQIIPTTNKLRFSEPDYLGMT